MGRGCKWTQDVVESSHKLKDAERGHVLRWKHSFQRLKPFVRVSINSNRGSTVGAAMKMNGRGSHPRTTRPELCAGGRSEAAIGRLPERESLQVKFCEKAGETDASPTADPQARRLTVLPPKRRNGCCAMREGPPQRVVLCAVFRSESGAIRFCIIFGESKR